MLSGSIARRSNAVPAPLPVLPPPRARAAGRALSTAWLMQLFALLEDRYTLYYPRLATFTGDAKTSLLLSRAISWTRLSHQQSPEMGNWIWQTGEQFERDTGLSRAEQVTARRRLAALGLWTEARTGVPARLLYRVNLDALAKSMTASSWQRRDRWSWDSECARAVLGIRPVPVYQRVVAITGDTLSALYLSQLISWTRSSLLNAHSPHQVKIEEGDAWIECPIAMLRDHLGLTRKVQRRCRQVLIERGLIRERYTKGLTPKLYTAVSLRAVSEAVQGQTRQPQHSQQSLPFAAVGQPNANAPKAISVPNKASRVSPEARLTDAAITSIVPARRTSSTTLTGSAEIGLQAPFHHRFQERATPEFEKLQNKDSTNANSGVALSSKLEWTEVQSWSGPKSQTGFADRATPLHTLREKRKPLLQQSSSIHPEAVTPFRAGSRRLEFVFPGGGLTAAEGLEIDRLAQHVGNQCGQQEAQQLIDELAYALKQTDKPVRNPVGYFAALVRRKQAGTFLPSGAHRVEMARTNRQAEAVRQQDLQQAHTAAQQPEQRERNREAAINALAAIRARRKGGQA